MTDVPVWVLVAAGVGVWLVTAVVVGVIVAAVIRNRDRQKPRLPEQPCWRHQPHGAHDWRPHQLEEPARCPGREVS